MKNAEEVVKKMIEEKRNVTTSQIRKILSGANLIANKIKIFQIATDFKEDTMPEELVNEINYLRVRIIYQAGREWKVKKLVDNAQLDQRLKNVGNDIKEYLEFNRFIEEIVAYHKYYDGGK